MSVKMLFRLFGFWAATFILPVWSLNWTPVVDVSVLGTDAVQSQVAVDAAGNATAIWIRTAGSDNIVQSSSKPLGGSWTTPVDLSLTGQNAVQAQITVDAAGNATAIWSRSNGTHNIIQSSYKLVGGNWTSPVDVSVAGANAFSPQVSVDPAGNAIAVWRRNDGSNDIIQSASRLLAQNWAAPVNLSAAGQNASEPQVTVDNNGNATAIWIRSNGANFIVQSSYKPFGGDWTSPVDLSAIGFTAGDPHIGVDAQGNLVAVWRRTSGANTIIQASSKLFGGDWTSPVDLTVTGLNALTPRLGVSANGDATAVWRRDNGANLIAQSSSKPFGGDWTSSVDLSAAGQSALTVQVAVDGVGSAIAVWDRSNGTNTIIQSASKLVGQGWTLPPVDLSATGQNAAAPAIAMNADGEAVVTWERVTSGTDTIIQSTSTSIIYPAQNGSGRQVLNQFAMQSERFNELKWDGSINDVAGYYIYRDGFFLNQVSANEFSYRDHLQTKGVRVVYTVTAVNAIGVGSTGITIIVQ